MGSQRQINVKVTRDQKGAWRVREGVPPDRHGRNAETMRSASQATRPDVEQRLAPFLEMLACPDDGAPLSPAGVGARCPRCGRSYPLKEGILQALPRALDQLTQMPPGDAAGPQSLPASQTLLEMRKRDEEARVYEEFFPPPQTAAELAAVLDPLGLTECDGVCEVGSGTGRLLRSYLPQARSVVGVDISWSSLLVAQESIQEELRPRVLLIQGDASALPLRASAFRCVVLGQLLMHLSPEGRTQCLEETARILKPGGRLALSVYHYSLVKQLHACFQRRRHNTKNGAWARAGYHSGGQIAYYNFSERELLNLLITRFEVRSVLGAVHDLPYLGRWLGGIYPRLDHFLGRLPWARRTLAHLLVVQGAKSREQDVRR